MVKALLWLGVKEKTRMVGGTEGVGEASGKGLLGQLVMDMAMLSACVHDIGHTLAMMCTNLICVYAWQHAQQAGF